MEFDFTVFKIQFLLVFLFELLLLLLLVPVAIDNINTELGVIQKIAININKTYMWNASIQITQTRTLHHPPTNMRINTGLVSNLWDNLTP